MSGFGTAALRDEKLAVFVELKTVNNRFLKLVLRVSDNFTSLEPRIETLLKEAISRGTVNLTVKVRKNISGSESLINTPLLSAYFTQLKTLSETLGLKNEISLGEILSIPGVLEDTSDQENLLEHAWVLAQEAIREALGGLEQMRKAEGASMAADLNLNIGQLEHLVGEVEKLAPSVAQNYRERLEERVGKIMAEHQLNLKPEDLVREVAVYSDRCDFSEETVRFRSHLLQFRNIIEKESNCGKKLDFLTQELFRETNTIGSKANDSEITKYVVEMKTAIERMREMVQNIE